MPCASPQDLTWPAHPVDECENHDSYQEFKDYVRAKSVVNDPAERALGLIKPIVKNFRREENLQAAMQVTKKVRATWTTGTIRGRKRKDFNKKELGKIKPSKLMKKEEDIVDSSTDSDNNSDVLDL